MVSFECIIELLVNHSSICFMERCYLSTVNKWFASDVGAECWLLGSVSCESHKMCEFTFASWAKSSTPSSLKHSEALGTLITFWTAVSLQQVPLFRSRCAWDCLFPSDSTTIRPNKNCSCPHRSLACILVVQRSILWEILSPWGRFEIKVLFSSVRCSYFHTGV